MRCEAWRDTDTQMVAAGLLCTWEPVVPLLGCSTEHERYTIV